MRHPKFARLFSSELNYAVILQDLIIFDTSTKEFKHQLSEMTGFDFDAYVKDNFAAAIDEIVYSLCTDAIPEALGRLGSDLISASRKARLRPSKQTAALREIRRDPSFADRRGLISFQRVGGKIEIGGRPTSRSDDYRRQLDRAVARIQSASIISRIHNKDPELVTLFREYDEELSSDHLNSSAAVSLWVVGQDIDNRIRIGQAATEDSEKLDDNTLHYLMTFLTAHNLYLQSFREIEQLSEDLGRSVALYQGLDERARSAPWSLLAALASDEGVFESRTQCALRKAASAIERPGTAQTKGLVSLGLGLLRGALRTMGATALEKVLGSDDQELIDETTSTVERLLSEPSLEREILLFLQHHKDRLLELAIRMPIFFHWVRVFLTMVGLN